LHYLVRQAGHSLAKIYLESISFFV